MAGADDPCQHGHVTSQPQPADSFYERARAAQGAGRYQDAVELLWQGVRQGEAAAMSLLGAQLVSGRGAPPDPPTGARLILEAAARGEGYACWLAAAIHALGLYGPPDWPAALDHLQRSAELGHGPAQAALKLLARHPGEVQRTASGWSQLRRRVDLKAWRKAPPPEALSEDPAIRVYRRFVAPEVCDWIIGRARDRLAPAMVFDQGAYQPVRSGDRTNSVAGFELVNTDLVVLLVQQRLVGVSGRPVASMEAPQVFHYAVGQEFAPHYDWLDLAIPGEAESVRDRGQRSHTLLVYLNEGFEGGETDFPRLGLRFKGRKGDAILFANVDAGGAPDPRMFHAGLPPTAGEKWLLSQWVRDRP